MFDYKLVVFCFFVSFALLASSQGNKGNLEEMETVIPLEHRHSFTRRLHKKSYQSKCVRWARFRDCPGR